MLPALLGGHLIFDAHAASAFDKVFPVPEKEHIDHPDMAGVILFSGFMRVQYLDQFIRVEEFLRLRAGEFLLYDVVVFVGTKPDTNRNRESKLLF